MTRGRLAVLAVAAAVLVTTGVVVWNREHSGVAVGTLVPVLDLADADALLPGGMIMLPVGRLDVQVSKPSRKLPDGAYSLDTGSRRAVEQVADHGRFLGVGWQLTGDPRDPRRTLAGGEAARFEVTLVADGTRYDLRAGEATRAGGRQKAVYLALPDDPELLIVEVAHDGIVQSLNARTQNRVTGAAQPLYSPATRWATTAKACTPDTGFPMLARGVEFREPRDAQVRCTMPDAVSGPYVTGRGWARPGRTWLAVTLTTRPVRLPFAYWPAVGADPYELYYLKLAASTVTLGGAAPGTTLPYFGQTEAELRKSDATGARYVFDVPVSGLQRLAVHQVWRSRPDADRDVPGAPATVTATADLTLDLSPAA
jgi:hypothetical protein